MTNLKGYDYNAKANAAQRMQWEQLFIEEEKTTRSVKPPGGCRTIAGGINIRPPLSEGKSVWIRVRQMHQSDRRLIINLTNTIYETYNN
ncbi:hypothetical protein J2X69_000432 [Algoriphagus sp. 4150]|nr:hypothetical protein [Algoriphagus sp. 4150]